MQAPGEAAELVAENGTSAGWISWVSQHCVIAGKLWVVAVSRVPGDLTSCPSPSLHSLGSVSRSRAGIHIRCIRRRAGLQQPLKSGAGFGRPRVCGLG